METQTVTRISLVGALALLIMLLVVGYLHAATNSGFKDAAAALAFISAAAIGIERVIEGAWTIIGATKGTFWPLTAVHAEVDSLVKDLDDAMQRVHDAAKKPLDAAATSLKTVDKAFARADAEKTQFERTASAVKARLQALASSPRDGQRLQLLAATAAQNVSYVSALYGDVVPELERAGRAANAAINGLQDFVATFKDNPGRRLVSLYVGVVLGLAVAGMLGLDLVAASLGTDVSMDSRRATLDILVTGILIGLGSNPTHEVIRAIQEYKKGRKGENALLPDEPTSPTPPDAPARTPAPDTSALATSQRVARLLRRLPDQPAQPTQPAQRIARLLRRLPNQPARL